MSGYLLVLSVGPVQEFLSAARRTRDLAAASEILSELSRAAARAVRVGGGKLIFPAPETDADLNDAPIANIILAEVDTAEQVEQIAAGAKAAVQRRWDAYAQGVKDKFGGYIDKARFEAQNRTVIEFYAAWAPVADGGYKEARARAMRSIGGRKACRDFEAFDGVAGVPKSSLDGARESVWSGKKPWKEMPEKQRLQLRLHEGEQLDAIGLVKRAGVERHQYPSIPRIAADPWLRGLKPDYRKKLKVECQRLGETVDRINPDRYPQFSDFLFEGSVVFVNRHREFDQPQVLEPMRKLLGSAVVQPYCAVLVADGDRMGSTISSIGSAEKHREFTRDLAKFATKARETAARHHGYAVYAGGDDVLAFLPLDTAIECADALRQDFAETMKDWKGPTLSVGVAIGHNLESLEDLLNWARAAEKDAKNPDRNGLAVHLYPRNGQPVKIRRQWGTGIAEHLRELAKLYQKDMFPDGAAYQLREMARHYASWTDATNLPAAMLADTRRLLTRKRADYKTREQVKKLAKERCGSAEDLLGFAEEMLVARRLADAYKQSGREPGGALA